ncbi:MAG: LLM class flavin-dependent oxidoreductase [Marmoricola sp.]
MSLTFHWFLPTYGDSRNLIPGGHGTSMRGDRPATLRYLNQVAAAAEQAGFESVLTPTGAWCEDAWLTTAMLVQETERLKFLVALRPGLLSPTLAAQMASTFQWQSEGRLLLNVVTGGEPREQLAYGDALNKADRYARCGEFLSVVRQLWAGEEPVTFTGDHVFVENATLQRRPDPVPPIYFGGSSPEAGAVAAEHADTYLTWGEPPAAVAEKVDWIRRLASQRGRSISYGIRLHVIARDTSEEAWAEAGRLLRTIPEGEIERVQAGLAQSESEGQKRMRDLHRGRDRDLRSLEVSPNLWSGVGLVRGGAGTALVGSHEEVSERISEYADLGIDHFILSGYPHLEEAWQFAEGVVPALSRRGLIADRAPGGPASNGEPVGVPFAAS